VERNLSPFAIFAVEHIFECGKIDGMETLSESLRTAAADVALLGDAVGDFRAMSNADLLSAQARITALRHCADRYAAIAAGEIGRRSTYELGDSGLARAGGFSSTEHMIQSLGNVSRQDAVKLLQVGTLIAQAEAAAAPDDGGDLAPDDATRTSSSAAPSLPALIAAALQSGALSIEAAESIRKGLGDVDAAVTEYLRLWGPPVLTFGATGRSGQ
jgi:hypothetical protein